MIYIRPPRNFTARLERRLQPPNRLLQHTQVSLARCILLITSGEEILLREINVSMSDVMVETKIYVTQLTQELQCRSCIHA